MGAAWRGPKERDLAPVLDMVRAVKALGLETCCTLGMLKDGQAEQLQATRDSITTTTTSTRRPSSTATSSRRAITRTGSTRSRACATRASRVCCGGIVGMGESRRQRAGLIAQLANLDPQPESVPINHLVQVEGTPLQRGSAARRRSIRSSSCARSPWRASRCRARWCGCPPGRRELGEPVQALCYFAGANSIFYGDRLLTTGNPDVDADRALFDKLGLVPA